MYMLLKANMILKVKVISNNIFEFGSERVNSDFRDNFKTCYIKYYVLSLTRRQ